MIRVMVVDDHLVVRQGLAACFEYRTEDVRVVGGCGRGDQVVDAAHTLAPDVVLMNCNMDGGDGWAATEALLAVQPHCHVIFFSAIGAGPADYARARAVGAVGYLHKSVDPDDLENYVREVAAGGTAWPGLLDHNDNS
ncbi:response regulator transcription factor [Blastococcus sp. TF02-09]|uniref:response regulator n=1 Tax=Blastococcus sp. TF02-09 TaxID=2250576 RepID=UPI0013144545|nr:response regulator transcription factor [Blastococcus sp. TF02-9]